jgi:SulP family sulfate permease
MILMLLKKYAPRAPGVLIVVVAGTVLSATTDFEKSVQVTPDQIEDPTARAAFTEYAALESAFVGVKQQQAELRKQVAALPELDTRAYQLQAETLRLRGDERSLKEKIYGHRVEVYRYAFLPVSASGGKTVYRLHASSFLSPSWHFVDASNGHFKLSGGGKVVGKIPAGLPAFAIPQLDLGVISGLLGTALVMALIGFMEATSISRALAAQSRDKLDPNQELIGQGIANIVGSFFHSYVVSGSFSRSAVAARSGARSGLYAVISAVGVVITMLYLTEYFYYLPQPVLAAIVMSAVFGLIDFKSLRQSWKVSRTDGVVGLATFAATLWMAPQLANGVLVGVVLTILIFLQSIMQPRSETMGINEHGVLAGAASNNLEPISPHYAVLRFDGSLIFINAAWFSEAVMRTQAQYPHARAILLVGDSINSIDATGEETLRTLVRDLKRADVTLMICSLKKPLRDVLARAGLADEIGAPNLFGSKAAALAALAERYDGSAAGAAQSV